VFLSIQNEREFGRFCEGVLGDASLAKDPRFASGPARAQNREAMHAEIHRVFGGIDSAEVVRRLEQADIANAELRDMPSFWNHPQMQARGRHVSVGGPSGNFDALKPPFNLDGFEPRMDAVPALGAHTRAILEELGYTEKDLA
jgi:itaconate CoA-transferase